MATEARRLGVTLETDAPVKRIVAENGRATGIELEDGRVIQGNAVAANLGPKPIFLLSGTKESSHCLVVL